ncbi:MAG: integrase [Alphaproteobacteria bacterium]
MGYEKSHLVLEGGVWKFRRRVPVDLVDVLGRKQIKRSLKTKSRDLAATRAAALDAEIEAQWASLRAGAIASAEDDRMAEFDAAVSLARSIGYEYRPSSVLAAAATTEELLGRIEAAVIAGAARPQSHLVAAAVLGAADQPALTFDRAFGKYQEMTRTERLTYSDDQRRRWLNPRLLALRNFKSVCGTPTLDQIDRNLALKFQEWWLNRIEDEGLTGNAANKDIGHLRKIFGTVNDKLRLGLENPFHRLSVPQLAKETREPFETAFIRDRILTSPKLMELNDDARWLIFMKADTGARNRELCGLDPEALEIRLDVPVPFIDIRPNRFRDLKVAHTKRQIPLVGAALVAATAMPAGTSRYRESPDSASAVINKFLRAHGMLPSDQHTLNSLRHSFEDRLTAVEPPDKVQAALMGHKYHRPRYGAGPSLAQKKTWLDRIAFTGLTF